MATEVQRERLLKAKRAGAKLRLKALGMDAELAERWLAAWEASSNMQTERHSIEFWERGGRWAADAWTAGQVPSTIEDRPAPQLPPQR